MSSEQELKNFLKSPEARLLANPKWRLNNLYQIVDREGNSIRFRFNDVQKKVYDSLHNRNLILKARQLGMSTFSVLYLLDAAMWGENISSGIVSYSLEHAQYIFKKIIGHAIDNLPSFIEPLCRIINRSARELSFENGSSVRVDTTLRGGSYQLVLVSEFGKTCARNPLKAEEVITGTLNSLSSTSRCIIESTGEGNEGFYAEMVYASNERGNKDLNPLDYYLHFFPWMDEPSYTMSQDVSIDITLADYFTKIEEETGRKLSQGQKNWYAHMRSTMGEKIKQEFPSLISEAFLAHSDAYYFQIGIEKAYQENRVLSTPLYDALEQVYVAMDIGATDMTVMVFFQVIHGEIRIIDYYEDNNKGVDFYARFLLQDKRYLYNTIFLPHDAAHKDGIVVENTYKREFARLFSHTATKFHVLPRTDKNFNISNAKLKIDRCVFNLNRVKPLIDQLRKYRKKWSEQYGKYIDEPFHDLASHYADSFIYAMQSVSHLETVGSMKGALEKHKAVVENRRFKM